jgi:predicted transcriptional regulator
MPLDPDKIRRRREALKLTVTEAARRAGMPQPNWSRIEAGEREDPRLSTAEKIAAVLRCGVLAISRH